MELKETVNTRTRPKAAKSRFAVRRKDGACNVNFRECEFTSGKWDPDPVGVRECESPKQQVGWAISRIAYRERSTSGTLERSEFVNRNSPIPPSTWMSDYANRESRMNKTWGPPNRSSEFANGWSRIANMSNSRMRIANGQSGLGSTEFANRNSWNEQPRGKISKFAKCELRTARGRRLRKGLAFDKEFWYSELAHPEWAFNKEASTRWGVLNSNTARPNTEL